ncbi:MFS transporter [Aquisalimonas asiatica]|uniref:Nitrate/nitrite transporter NarK n=1 Tax=Aquisalimonas asiatica TaxID=406100 RepID=A0A1H8Q469_9GAMM|nr:MFS transporter [Aquisalimonas asiatica]SEO49010.1 Nitrate/nitrite transporter NarK [Aquisalimonas asiatica]
MGEAVTHGTGRPPAWLMVGTGMLVTVVVLVFARLAYGLIVPPMRESLGLSYQQAGMLGTVTALGYLCLVMVAGFAAGRFGGRNTVLIGVVLVTVGFAGLSVASDYRVLLLLMALLGFGTAFGYTPLVSLLSTWFPEQRGAVIGMLNGGVGAGMLVAGMLVPLAPAVFGEAGWRVTWAAFAVGGALVLMAVMLFLRDPPVATSGAAKAAPVDRAAVFRNRHVIIIGLIYGVLGTTYIVQVVFMYSYALESGVASVVAGRLAALMGAIGIFSGLLWGWISDRIGRGTALLLSKALYLVGMLIPVLSPTLAGFAAHYVILGIAVTGVFTSVLAASTEHVGAREAPLAVSFVTVFMAAGQLAGPVGAGVVIDWTGDFRLTFALCAVLIAVGVALSWRVRSYTPEPVTSSPKC